VTNEINHELFANIFENKINETMKTRSVLKIRKGVKPESRQELLFLDHDRNDNYIIQEVRAEKVVLKIVKKATNQTNRIVIYINQIEHLKVICFCF